MLLIDLLNRSGLIKDPCGKPAITSFQRLKLLFTPVLSKGWFK